MTISQYFHKVKSLCREIGELDPEGKIGEPRMKRIIIHGLKAEFRSFVAAVQGWATQPNLSEFENLLASQEALDKQMGGLSTGSSSKTEVEALYASKGKNRSRSYRSYDKSKNQDRGERKSRQYDRDEKKSGDRDRADSGGEKKHNNKGKRFPYKCYKCGERGHMARNCRSPVDEEGNVATTQDDDGWDAEAFIAQTEDVFALTATTDRKDNKLDDWIVDSGCSNHMTGDMSKLNKTTKYGGSQVVVLADNSRHPIDHVGEVNFPSGKQDRKLILKDVYHVTGMKKNLFFVQQMTENGYYVLFGPKEVKIYKEFETPSTPVLLGRKNERVYVLSAEAAYLDKVKGSQNADLWHQRMGHVGYDMLGQISDKALVRGLPRVQINKEVVCSGCQYGKAKQQPFPSSTFQAIEPLQLVHSDVFGPVKQFSIKGKRYMVTFIDDYSRFVWIYFMKEKAEVFAKFKEFELDAKLVTGRKVGCLRSDNGGEYLAHEFSNYLKQKGIKRQLTCSNTPQQNGVSERKNRHLGEITRSLIHDKNLPGRFWAEAMHTAGYVINRLPSQSLDYMSPYEKLTGNKPDVSYFRVFGCVCYVFIPAHLRHKMEKKAVRCVFAGYDEERKGWRCIEPSTGKAHVSRNVIFDEQSSWWSEDNQPLPDTSELQKELEVKLSFEEAESAGIDENDNAEPEVTEPVNEESEPDLRRSQRVRKPNPRYANMANLAVVTDEFREPENYEEASQKSEWVEAMREEMNALLRNQTWELTPKPSDVTPVSCKWTYKLKQRPDGSVERYKARLVARGFSQTYGVDYEETFSPVAKLTTIRTLLAIAVNKGWKLWQMDVSNAFLYGDLEHTIYMEQPLGFVDQGRPDYVCKLRKAIYGLKQSSRAWFGKIGEFLEQNGFALSDADSSLFVKKVNDKIVVVLVYVDDLIITGDVEEEINQLKANLCVRFKMKDLGRLSHFLGLELTYVGDSLLLHQTKYASDLLSKFKMAACKPAATPIECNPKLYVEQGRELEDPTEYRKLVGSLIYLTLTRPDLSFSVGVLSRFMQCPRKPHMIAMKRVLRYIKGTVEQGVWFKRENEPKLIGFCDADYAGDLNERRSTTGYVFMYGSGAVSWRSKRQPTVSLSTTEAEYRAAAVAAQECIWLVRLLRSLHQVVDYSVKMFCDNISAIKLAENPVFHDRTKHIEIYYHFIRERVLKEDIEMKAIKTTEQVADAFTKSLPGPGLLKFCNRMNLGQLHIEREC
ncbi:putative RNA-directed DNA polymerase [Helianthus annuus]|nr:putative RNA-directed DNA polymerase [Helianthus annuus]KAJ0431335.1 putative RNA-directed DNA polymerase [Helianthus annuus]